MLSVVSGNFQVLRIRQSIWGMIHILHECIHMLHELRIMIQKGWGLNMAPPENLPNSIQGPSRDAQIMASTGEIKFPSQPPHWHLTFIAILPQIARTIYDPRGDTSNVIG